MTLFNWSKTAATNATADATINWAEGQAPSSVNDSARALMAAVKKYVDDNAGTITTGGSSTAYTVTTNQVFTTAALMSGARICFIPHTTSGAAPTLAVDGLTARAINSSTGSAVATGALIAGTPYVVTYIHASTQFILNGVLGASVSLASLDIIGGTSETAIATNDTFPIYDLSATANRRMLLSDILKVVNLLTEDTSPDRAADYVQTYDTSATAAKKVLLSNLPAKLPRGYIDGCNMSNNATDATNDIDITAGTCRDSTNTVDIVCAAMTGKQLDANWAAGSAAGLRNSGVGIANGTYHIYAVAKADGTQDYYAHTSTTVATVITALQAETGGSAYLYARRIGSILRESLAIVAFTQDGDYFVRSVPAADIALNNPGTTAVLHTLSVPLGLKVFADIAYHAEMGSTSSTTYFWIHDPAATNSAASISNATFVSSNANNARVSGVAQVRADTSGRVRSRQDASSSQITLNINTRGWRDTRGKDA